ncbi:hypothetical protein [Egicoccus sp. AB-alg2]|uniref:hypothetical protein n=1 Tax=Egicoccus sp. AB-alg2 TaxID=3242693 RepID=UPI00359D570C
MTDTVTAEPHFDEQLLTAAIRRLRQAEQQATAARSHATVAKEQLALALIDAAAAYRDTDVLPPRELVDRLYWEVRDLRVNDIARAFGIAPAELKRLVTPRVTSVTCRTCRKPTEVETAKRSEPAYVQCDGCRRAQEWREERAWAQESLQREEPPYPDDDLPLSYREEPPPPLQLVGAYPPFDAPPFHDEICDVCAAPAPEGRHRRS